MKTKLISKMIDIEATADVVWNVLVDDRLTRIWYSHFSEGSHAETDWNVGSKALFTDNSGCGMIGKIVANDPNKFLSIEYQGVVVNSKEEYDSPVAQDVKGGRETYRLSDNGQGTRLSIECDMDESMYESMADAWNRALHNVKELSEKTAINI